MRWLFTDKALYFEPWKCIMAVKAGSLEEYGLLERWGEPGQAPASLLLESCVQTARWLVEASSSFTQSCDVTAIDYWRSMEGLHPGERYCVLLRVLERHENRLALTANGLRVMPGAALPGAAFRNEPGEADGTFSVSFTPLAARCLPADRECLWREIRP
jgi:hypothetical protein